MWKKRTLYLETTSCNSVKKNNNIRVLGNLGYLEDPGGSEWQGATYLLEIL